MPQIKPLPPTMDPANKNKNPPFAPVVLPSKVGPTPVPQGTYQEAGIFQKLYDYIYAGQNQTAVINFKWPSPVNKL